MQVKIKDMQVSMDLGTKGIELEIKDNAGTHLGDLRIGKANAEWCRGRTRVGNGVKVKLERLIELIEMEG